MTKYEFLGDLSRLLSDLSEEERSEAMQYYEDYFADAGREQEQAIIQELESPEKVAAKIHGTTSEEVEYGEQSEMRDAAYLEPRGNSSSSGDSNFTWQNSGTTEGFRQTQGEGNEQRSSRTTMSDPTSNRALKWGLLLILIIVAIPVILPVVTTVFGLLIAVIAIVFALFCALFGCGIGLGVGGVASIFVGLFHCAMTDFSDGILYIGTGLILLPIGIILCYVGMLLVLKLAPGTWKLCQRFWNWLSSMAQKLIA